MIIKEKMGEIAEEKKALYYAFFGLIVLCLVLAGCLIIFGSTKPTGFFVGNFSAGVKEPVEIVISAGGAAAEKPACNVSFEEQFVSLELLQGMSKIERINIKNLCGRTSVSVMQEGLEQFLKIEETSFLMEKGEEKTIFLNFKVSENAAPGMYRGKIFIKGIGFEKIVYIILQVRERAPLYDVIVEIWSGYDSIRQGEIVKANITLRNIGLKDDVRTILNLGVESISGEKIFDAPEEIFVVEKEFPMKTLTRELQLPSDIRVGNYFLVAKAGYDSLTAEAYDIFEVKERIRRVVYIAVGGVIAGALIVLVIAYLVAREILKALFLRIFARKGREKVAIFK